MTETVQANGDSAALVVIGASAGGVETLRRVVAGLDPGLPAAVCVVLHLAPESPSALAGIMARAGRLPCRAASGEDRLTPGQVLVAPPDHHLVVADNVATLNRDPPENGHRPAVDVLFRSAAQAWEKRVVGVVLSGNGNDGTNGLAAIKDHGGIAIVQDPDEALYPAMPASAIAHVDVDAVAPSSAIAATIAQLVNEHVADVERDVASPARAAPPGSGAVAPDVTREGGP